MPVIPSPVWPNELYDGGVYVNEGSDPEGDDAVSTQFILGSSINRMKSEIRSLELEFGVMTSGALRGSLDSLADRLAVSIGPDGTFNDFSVKAEHIEPGIDGQLLLTSAGVVSWTNFIPSLIEPGIDNQVLQTISGISTWTVLDASTIGAGILPLARLEGITENQLDPAAAIVVGSGLQNHLLKFSANGSGIEDSSIIDNGTSVLIPLLDAPIIIDDVLPQTDNAYNLGSATFQWAKVFSTLFKGGGFQGNVTGITSGLSPYTIPNSDFFIPCNAVSGAITVNLPNAGLNSGMIIFIIKTDASVNAITINPTGGATINGFSSVSLTSQFNSYTLVSDGANWSRQNSLPSLHGVYGGTYTGASNSAAFASLIPTNRAGTATFNANTLAVGDIIRIKCTGKYTFKTAPMGDLLLELYFTATGPVYVDVHAASFGGGFSAPLPGSTGYWVMESDIVITSIGVGGTFTTNSTIYLTSDTIAYPIVSINSSAITLNTTVQQVLDFGVQFSTADVNNIFQGNLTSIELLRV